MGSTSTPTYRVEFHGVVDLTARRRVVFTPQAWDCKRDGRPTDSNLQTFIRSLEASTLPGGINEQLGVTVIGSADVIRQATDEIVAAYAPVMFTVAS